MKVEKMPRETRKEYRMRLVLWIVQTHPGWNYEQIVSEHNKLEGTITAKESIVRDIKTLELREMVYSETPNADGRMRLWYGYDK